VGAAAATGHLLAVATITMSTNKLRIVLGTMTLAAALWVVPRSAPANVNPVTLIERQMQKPNMLIVLDTSGSMSLAPGSKESYTSEVGVDCDESDKFCRQEGYQNRCVLSGGGSRGAGYNAGNTDTSDCTNSSQCTTGYCATGYSTSDSRTCTTNANCTGSSEEFCQVVPNDRCITSAGKVRRAKTCRIGANRCWDDSDCTSIAGDSCGPASSRMVVVKRVIADIVGDYYKTVNLGLMSYYQTGYYPYYPVSGSVTYTTATRFLDQGQLTAANCWTKAAGPSATCALNGFTYTLTAAANSRYRNTTGAVSFTNVDASWCGVWCTNASGTGYYMGSYFTYPDPIATVNPSSSSISQQSTYQGKSILIGGNKYLYWDPSDSSFNQDGIFMLTKGCALCADGTDLPFDGASTAGSSCGATCGGKWNTAMAPFMDISGSATLARTNALAVMARMDKARYGGLMAVGATPIGCALWNDYSGASKADSAYHYMMTVKAADTLGCRRNYVLLVTDGAPTGNKDDNCDAAACGTDPPGATCTCQSVLGAKKLKDAGVSVYVVGFAAGVSDRQVVLNNIARAGGTYPALFATREQDLRASIVSAIYGAAKGSYSTSPASASSGTQNVAGAVQPGTLLLDTRVDFPGWKGQLTAFDTTTTPPSLVWSASTVAFNATTDPTYWKKRNLWTSNGTTMVRFDVDQTTGAINNKATLKTLGLGATDAEAELVARWLLGDPALGNPAVLGAMINSTPTDVGPPGISPLPGGQAFHDANVSRPNLTYVGASDGMLHAFFTKPVTVGSTTYAAGKEAFAYIPQTMLAVQNKLYAQGGQLPDPQDHIYGLANSPKAKNVCTAYCDGLNVNPPEWKTTLAMAYGFGGTESFVLDITTPFDGAGIKRGAVAPAPLIWSTQYLSAGTTSAYDNDLGLTTSVPAFYYAKSASKDDYRLLFGSYTSDVATGVMGKVLINASVATGAMTDTDTISPIGTCLNNPLGLLSDVATARNFNGAESSQILAAYFGDTWGDLYRYVPSVGTNNYTGSTGTITTAIPLNCNEPLHYAPAIVQLDRDNPVNRPGEIYLVQVTNSGLDDNTKGYAPSQMIIRRDIASASGSTVVTDSTWTNIVLAADGSSTGLCGVTAANGSCTTRLPAGTNVAGVWSGLARPNATPTVVLRQDGLGFDVISTWYLPPVDACTDGTTYLNITEINVNGTAALKYAKALASEPVTSTVFVGGKLMFVGSGGPIDLSPNLPTGLVFVAGSAGGTMPPTPERFRKLGWTELP
jgi:Neisseria PilC beta-propeller domain